MIGNAHGINSKLSEENIIDTMREIDELERQFKAKIGSTKKSRDGGISDGLSDLFLVLSYSLFLYISLHFTLLFSYYFSLFPPFLLLT